MHELTAAIASFTDINVSQGSVATLVRCGGIINNHFIANFPQSMPVKEFLKPAIFGDDMDKRMVACFFWLTVYIAVIQIEDIFNWITGICNRIEDIFNSTMVFLGPESYDHYLRYRRRLLNTTIS